MVYTLERGQIDKQSKSEEPSFYSKFFKTICVSLIYSKVKNASKLYRLSWKFPSRNV